VNVRTCLVTREPTESKGNPSLGLIGVEFNKAGITLNGIASRRHFLSASQGGNKLLLSH